MRRHRLGLIAGQGERLSFEVRGEFLVAAVDHAVLLVRWDGGGAYGSVHIGERHKFRIGFDIDRGWHRIRGHSITSLPVSLQLKLLVWVEPEQAEYGDADSLIDEAD